MSPTYTSPKPTSPSFSRFHSSPTPSTMQPPKFSTSTLLSLSTQKLHHLSSLLSSSPRDSPDLLRKGVLIQNAMDWGVVERRREKEREREGVRKMQMQMGGGRRKSEGAVKMMVAVVEEAEEEEEEEAAEEQAMARVELATTSITSSSASIESSSENGMVVDPSEYLFAHEEEVIIQEEQDEAEAAWFEEHWNDLQAENHAQAVKSTPTITPFSAVTTDVSVQIYSVESDSDSDDSLPTDQMTPGRISPESLTSLTAHPQAMEISPPPSPKLSPTRLSDKLEAPMEFGTMPARLESAISFEDFQAVWEVRGMDEAFIMPFAPVAESVSAQEMVIYDDVPALGEDSETDEEEEKDNELLITPGEEALEEFGAASYESESEMEEMRLIGVKGKN